jgi:hypothetical protein
MYAALWICAPLVECLSNLALRANYDDGNRGVTEAVLRNAPHALRAKGNSERLLHRAIPTRANYDGLRTVKGDEAINCRSDFSRYILDDDR